MRFYPAIVLTASEENFFARVTLDTLLPKHFSITQGRMSFKVDNASHEKSSRTFYTKKLGFKPLEIQGLVLEEQDKKLFRPTMEELLGFMEREFVGFSKTPQIPGIKIKKHPTIEMRFTSINEAV